MSFSSDVAERIRTFEGSTTLLLEAYAGKQIKIGIVSQSEENQSQSSLLIRASKLFFNNPEAPVIYSLCRLNLNQLTNAEYELLVAGETPIGKIFFYENRMQLIRKENVKCVFEYDWLASRELNVKTFEVYKKEYIYWVGSRQIGKITEIFNYESLLRLKC